MVLRSRPGSYAFADFLELVSEDQKADLLDGVIYMASPENMEHAELVGWLNRLVGSFVEEQELGRVTINKVAYRLSGRDAPEPDLAFVRTARLGGVKYGYFDGPPDVAVEIVSPESVERDYEHKRRRYEQAGVEEYWIIDPDEKRVLFLVLSASGGERRFEEAQLDGTVFHSKAVPGLYLDTQWLWHRPLPKTMPIVQEMLRQASQRREQ